MNDKIYDKNQLHHAGQSVVSTNNNVHNISSEEDDIGMIKTVSSCSATRNENDPKFITSLPIHNPQDQTSTYRYENSSTPNTRTISPTNKKHTIVRNDALICDEDTIESKNLPSPLEGNNKFCSVNINTTIQQQKNGSRHDENYNNNNNSFDDDNTSGKFVNSPLYSSYNESSDNGSTEGENGSQKFYRINSSSYNQDIIGTFDENVNISNAEFDTKLKNLLEEMEKTNSKLTALEEEYNRAFSSLTVKQKEFLQVHPITNISMQGNKLQTIPLNCSIQINSNEALTNPYMNSQTTNNSSSQSFNTTTANRGMEDKLHLTYSSSETIIYPSNVKPLISNMMENGSSLYTHIPTFSNTFRPNTSNPFCNVALIQEILNFQSQRDTITTPLDSVCSANNVLNPRISNVLSPHSPVNYTTQQMSEKSGINAIESKQNPQIYVVKFNFDAENGPYNSLNVAQQSLECRDQFYLPVGMGDFVVPKPFLKPILDDFVYVEKLSDSTRGYIPKSHIEPIPNHLISDYLKLCHLIYMAKSITLPSIESNADRSKNQTSTENKAAKFEKSFSVEAETTSSIDSSKMVNYASDNHPYNRNQEFNVENFDNYLIGQLVNEYGANRIFEDGTTTVRDAYIQVSPPVCLIVEKVMKSSVLISWCKPKDTGNRSIHGYQVVLDGAIKYTIKKDQRTRALIEKIDLNLPHRICIRTLTVVGHSNDALCTTVVGRVDSIAPTRIKVCNISKNSCLIVWLPSDTNNRHLIFINDIQVTTTQSGVVYYKLTGLTPSTLYKLKIQAQKPVSVHSEPRGKRSLSALGGHQFSGKPMDNMGSRNRQNLSIQTLNLVDDEFDRYDTVKRTSYQHQVGRSTPKTTYKIIEFKTLPGRTPKPPTNVIIEPGPQDGAFLLSWDPIIVNESAPNDNEDTCSLVTGYIILFDGKPILRLKSPTEDHILLNMDVFLQNEIPTFITIRSVSGESESADSLPARFLERPEPQSRHLEMDYGPTTLQTDDDQTTPVIPAEYTSPPRPYFIQPPTEFRDAVWRQPGNGWKPQEDFNYSRSRTKSFTDVDGGYQTMYGATSNAINEQQQMMYGTPYYPPPRQMMMFDNNVNNPGAPSYNYYYYAPPDLNIASQKPFNMPMAVDYNENNIKRPEGYNQSVPMIWVQALFTYDPFTMSPNDPESAKEELPFRIGQNIRVLTPLDTDGFFWGSLDPYFPELLSPSQSNPYGLLVESQIKQILFGRENGTLLGRVVGLVPINMVNGSGPSFTYLLSTAPPPDQYKSNIAPITTNYTNFNTGNIDTMLKDNNNNNVKPQSTITTNIQSNGYEVNRDNRDSVKNSTDIERMHPELGFTSFETVDTPPSRPKMATQTTNKSTVKKSDSPSSGVNRQPYQSPQTKPQDTLTAKRGNTVKTIVTNKSSESERLSATPSNTQKSEPNVQKSMNAAQSTKKTKPNAENIQRERKQNVISNENRNVESASKNMESSKPFFPKNRERRMIALYDYDPKVLSPNVDSDLELSFKTGDVIIIEGDLGPDGFYTGILNGVKGFVPSNFLKELPPLPEDDGIPLPRFKK